MAGRGFGCEWLSEELVANGGNLEEAEWEEEDADGGEGKGLAKEF